MSEYIIEMKHITKRFPGIVANDDVTLQIKKGEIFALLGENGAGKSTLMSMIFGMYEPDEGEIFIRGKKEQIHSPSYATKLNIGMVHQHFKLVQNYTITENIILGLKKKDKLFGILPYVDLKKADQEIEALSKKYGLEVNPIDVIENTSVSTQQRVEILKMLYREAEILIFDEPTAVLTPQEIESLLLTKKDMINKQLGDLNLMKNFGCTVTRVRRSGIDLSPSPDLALKFGDKLMVVGEKDGIKGVARLLGNDNKQLSDTDFFPIALGIVLGVLFGKLNISFSDSLSFSPGLTGGILMVALFLSAIGKTGPILWSMSGPANQLLRQLGLLLFLAEVGTSAGRNLVATFQESGWLLFGVGAAITLVPMLVAVIVGLFVFKINILDLLGTITGGMTSTPGLAAADSMTDSNIPSVAYATVYPIAMVFLILIIQVISSAVY